MIITAKDQYSNTITRDFKPIYHPIYILSRYMISDDGFIYNIKRNIIMSPYIDNSGYRRIKLQTDNGYKDKKLFIHQLVLRTWVGDPPENMEDPTVDHIDGNKLNNHYSNLRWMTRSKNSIIYNRMISEETVDEILDIWEHSSKICLDDLYKMFDFKIGKSTLRDLLKGRYYKEICDRHNIIYTGNYKDEINEINFLNETNTDFKDTEFDFCEWDTKEYGICERYD